ncbi:MAG: phosphate propanoyltransferase [Halanaerobiales bacterium]
MAKNLGKIKKFIKNKIIREVARNENIYYLPAGVSNRHLHLSRSHLENLFGTNYELGSLKGLSQPGQFAAEETVTLKGPKGKLEKVRVLGPVREETQVEISITDSYKLGVEPVIRKSGNLEGTPGVKLYGPRGKVELSKGVIVAARHLHLSGETAKIFGLQDGDRIEVEKKGVRPIIFRDVIVRVSPDYFLEFHIDTDEANAANIKNGDLLIMRPGSINRS